jgi:hypothetical protein
MAKLRRALLESTGQGIVVRRLFKTMSGKSRRIANTTIFGDAPGYPGYFLVNSIVPSGIASGMAASGRLNYRSRPSNEVTVEIQ